MLLGTWKLSGLHAVNSNVVYGSRDKLNRINRRISKESPTGNLTVGGNYNFKKTACRHEDIDYLDEYKGMTDDEVKSHIMPLLIAGGGAFIDIPIPMQTESASNERKGFSVYKARFFENARGDVFDNYA